MNQNWIKQYPDYIDPRLSLPGDTLVDRFQVSCAQNGGKDALVGMGTGMTYSELQGHADNFTSWLQQNGIEPGDRVAIMLPNILAYPVCLFGALQGGYVVVNCNPLYTPRELTHQLADSGARVIVVLENFAHVVQQVLPSVRVEKVVVATLGDLQGFKAPLVNLVVRHVKHLVPDWRIEGHVPFAAALRAGHAKRPVPHHVGQDDIALLQYTGGTTGVSKGAVLTHGNLIAHETLLEAWVKPALEQMRKDGSVSMAIMPLYHISALMLVLVPTLMMGATCVLVANPRALDDLIKTMRHYRIGILSGINTLYNALLNHPDILKVDLTALRLCAAGGAATQHSVNERWHALTGLHICEGYGMSEASGALTVNRIDSEHFSGTGGMPLPLTDISIRGEDGAEVGDGGVGEVCAKGPQVMRGYWGRPEDNATAMTADGYLKTGDIGYLDQQGMLHLVDRKKDMILVSGFNVFPNEVEEVLASLPGVMEAAVIGVEDERSGEAVCAIVVPRDTSLTKDAIAQHCRANLAAYKCPRIIEMQDTLPKTPVGKILRRALREEWRQRPH
ncbi:AMP-binding protein [Pseudoduganella namucuonensis]|uniref:Long-chain-fatty-acid--CoA ligase n=1 Tax=Pseudoduganella namucuonensis TaxID=1035707 RepID=A0A1I7IZJ2_9BURK|nr:AMP-binding protein [Pseudoduganella namucuonensis]SFU78221.1 long-chain acyl-CoA synthetase [Pseudoduganella namucuonensis]